jgi:hypothetical protein
MYSFLVGYTNSKIVSWYAEREREREIVLVVVVWVMKLSN